MSDNIEVVVDKGEPSDTVLVNVRLAGGGSTQTTVERSITVAQLKLKLFPAELSEGKAVRMIFRGRALPDDQLLASIEGFDNGCFVHTSVTDAVDPRVMAERRAEEAAPRPALGLDIFREQGFSEEEVQAMRVQFHGGRHLYLGEAQMRQREQEWMDDVTPAADGAAASVATSELEEEDTSNRDFFWGVLMGFTLGIAMFIWVWEQAVSRHTKFGILAGVLCNISFGLLRLFVIG